MSINGGDFAARCCGSFFPDVKRLNSKPSGTCLNAGEAKLACCTGTLIDLPYYVNYIPKGLENMHFLGFRTVYGRSKFY
jgi:hypothetical protein